MLPTVLLKSKYKLAEDPLDYGQQPVGGKVEGEEEGDGGEGREQRGGEKPRQTAIKQCETMLQLQLHIGGGGCAYFATATYSKAPTMCHAPFNAP